MLKQLSVQNYALIEALQLEAARGLSVITGETGAGKSILLGALSLLLGHRNQRGRILLNESQKCVIEGIFDVSSYDLSALFETEDIDYASETILRRELLPNAKSRAFVNDTPVGLEFVRRLGEQLIDIHSQHETTLLTKRNFQRLTLDSWGNHHTLLDDYNQKFSLYKSTETEYAQKKAAWTALQSQQDYLTFQLRELKEAELRVDEQSELEAQLEWIEAHQQRAESYQHALTLLEDSKPSLLQQLAELTHTLEVLSLKDEQMSELLKRTESTRLELKDIAEALEKGQRSELSSPEEATQIEERLSLIYSLQKKHHLESCAALLELEAQLSAQLEGLDRQEEELEDCKKRLHTAESALHHSAHRLTQARAKASVPLSEAIVTHLRKLGMPHAQFSVARTAISPQQDGADQIVFVFSANTGIKPQPLAEVASGGEKSRLMFVVKYLLAAQQSLPTLIFDEIDTGISGETAKRMIHMMEEIAKQHQVILISHLPQFAARAERHFLIYKEERNNSTVSRVRALTEKERIQALAEMIDGATPSIEALENARKMRVN